MRLRRLVDSRLPQLAEPDSSCATQTHDVSKATAAGCRPKRRLKRRRHTHDEGLLDNAGLVAEPILVQHLEQLAAVVQERRACTLDVLLRDLGEGAHDEAAANHLVEPPLLACVEVGRVRDRVAGNLVPAAVPLLDLVVVRPILRPAVGATHDNARGSTMDVSTTGEGNCLQGHGARLRRRACDMKKVA